MRLTPGASVFVGLDARRTDRLAYVPATVLGLPRALEAPLDRGGSVRFVLVLVRLASGATLDVAIERVRTGDGQRFRATKPGPRSHDEGPCVDEHGNSG